MPFASLDDIRAQIGDEIGVSSWLLVDQERIDAFADATEDRQFIHVDPATAAQTPFGGTIAHGYLTLSLLAPITQQLLVVTDATTSINYGLNKLRFPGPLPVGAEFRGRGAIVEVAPFEKGVQITASFTIEVKDAPRPALAAECLFRYYR